MTQPAYDTDLLVRVFEGTKTCVYLSNLSCASTQSAGLVELSLDDHILEQVMDEDSLLVLAVTFQSFAPRLSP